MIPSFIEKLDGKGEESNEKPFAKRRSFFIWYFRKSSNKPNNDSNYNFKKLVRKAIVGITRLYEYSASVVYLFDLNEIFIKSKEPSR